MKCHLMIKPSNTEKPDLTQGIAIDRVASGAMLLGRVDDEDVLLVRVDDEWFAVRGACTHYRGALVDGLIVGDTVRCPLHHACFSLRTGDALRAPALDPLTRWRVERRGDMVFVREKYAALQPPSLAHRVPGAAIVGCRRGRRGRRCGRRRYAPPRRV